MSTFSSSRAKEIEHITQEMYKKNLELAQRNRTLLLIRKLQEIILSSVTDISSIGTQITDTVVAETGFKSVCLRILNHSKTTLLPLSASVERKDHPSAQTFVKDILTKKVMITHSQGILAKAVTAKKMQRTKHMYFLPCPGYDIDECRKLQKAMEINEFLVYPLIARERVIGTLSIGVGGDTDLTYIEQKDLLDRLPGIISIALENSLLYETIAKTNDRLKELDKLKDDFVSIASHELRTPMTAIKSYLWMIINKSTMKLDEKTKSYLDIAYTSTERLIKLVGNMLTISRIEGKRLELAVTKLDLPDLVKDVFAEVIIKAHEGKIKLTLNAPKKPIFVMGDKDKLHEVIMNLLGNSLKFTPCGGSIVVAVKPHDRSVDVSVTDTGPGMSPEDKEKLFHKFGLMGSSYAKTNNASGTGLGLFITKQILAMHKGHITVESELGKGSTFTFTLPL